ncbi:MAG: ImmA/IrrE family metallo-endopeptidase [Kiritimatiellae bacterium]|nr:ImmA/IrrE family metallo-endopeptidase [Kiritimatiellia bacterium]
MSKNLIEMTGGYLVPPGEHIQDWLTECGMPVLEFCKRMEISKPTYYRILNGTQPITADTARRLELVTGASVEFWSKLEADYRHQVLCQEAEEQAKNQKIWIKKQPVADLIAAKFLPADFRKRRLGEQLSALCSFYNVSSVDAYEEIHTPYSFAARAVKGVESNSTALTAWLQMAARVALEHMPALVSYDAKAFRNALDMIRHQTAAIDSGDLAVKGFLLQVKAELAKTGVEVIYLKKVKDVKNLNGVAFWLKEHPVIVLTLHSCALDRIVFSLYHESAHILDGRRELIYVTDKENSDIELEADAKAAEMLIPSEFDDQIRGGNGSLSAMRDIAKRVGVSVALVVGRYQKLCNRFFTTSEYHMPMIKWDDIGSWVLA